MLLSIIIPVYNEEQFIATVIKNAKSVVLPEGVNREIIVVNDGSTDKTTQILEDYKNDPLVKVFYHAENKGKSASVIWGIEEASGDILLIQDADLEYDPCHYPKLIEPILSKKAEVVYGSRFKGEIHHMAPINRFANFWTNITFNLLYRQKISDLHTCYKVFSKNALKRIDLNGKKLNGNDLHGKKFVFDGEITVRLAKNGHTIYEVPISYSARTKKEGKKITWGQALQIYWSIIALRFK